METEEYLRYKEIPQQRTHREVVEMQNHVKAWEYVRNTLSTLNPDEYKVATILRIHYYVTVNVLPEKEVGQLRTTEVKVSNSPLITPKHEELQAILEHFIDWFVRASKTMHPVHLAIAAHIKLLTIQPFTDFNGRVARLLMNAILLHFNYPPTTLQDSEQQLYYNALQVHAMTKDTTPFINLMLSDMVRTTSRLREIITKICKG